MRRGTSPSLEFVEALCRVLGFRLHLMPLDESHQPPEEFPAVERRPEWSRRLQEEIRQDLVEILGGTGEGGLGRTDWSRTTGKRKKDSRVLQVRFAQCGEVR